VPKRLLLTSEANEEEDIVYTLLKKLIKILNKQKRHERTKL